MANPVELTWKIPHFSRERVNASYSQAFVSPTFSFGFSSPFDMLIYLYPKGSYKYNCDKKEHETAMAIFVFIVDKKRRSGNYYVELSFLDCDGLKCMERGFTYEKVSQSDRGITECDLLSELNKAFRGMEKNALQEENDRGFFRFVWHRQLESLREKILPNDTLTICCRVHPEHFWPWSFPRNRKMSLESRQSHETRNRINLARDFESLLLNPMNADVIFLVENSRVFAHKIILAIRSPVFATIFQNDMKKRKTNEMKIVDMSSAVLCELLRFIYTGSYQCEKLSEGLLYAANRYDLKDLKQICEDEMCKKLTVCNVVRLLIMSGLHQAKKLKRAAIFFIIQNKACVIKEPDWNNLTEFHPNLIAEIEAFNGPSFVKLERD